MKSQRRIEVLFTPAEFEALSTRDLATVTCVVFDVLRATTSMITALANGATLVMPVADIPGALALRRRDPDYLLAGERQGLRIRADQANGVDFDFGNSPREFTPDRVRDRRIAMTTTNGTCALRAAGRARRALVTALINLQATADEIRRDPPANLPLIGAGTHEEAALEDVLAAGALCDRVWDLYGKGHVADSALMALQLYRQHQADLPAAVRLAQNARRLLAQPELRDDVDAALRIDSAPILVTGHPDGTVRPVALESRPRRGRS